MSSGLQCACWMARWSPVSPKLDAFFPHATGHGKMPPEVQTGCCSHTRGHFPSPAWKDSLSASFHGFPCDSLPFLQEGGRNVEASALPLQVRPPRGLLCPCPAHPPGCVPPEHMRSLCSDGAVVGVGMITWKFPLPQLFFASSVFATGARLVALEAGQGLQGLTATTYLGLPWLCVPAEVSRGR